VPWCSADGGCGVQRCQGADGGVRYPTAVKAEAWYAGASPSLSVLSPMALTVING
jgi:hypothetical protein